MQESKEDILGRPAHPVVDNIRDGKNKKAEPKFRLSCIAVTEAARIEPRSITWLQERQPFWLFSLLFSWLACQLSFLLFSFLL